MDASIPDLLEVALDAMREQGLEAEADACALGIVNALKPPKQATEWATSWLMQLVRAGMRPTRLGVPGQLVNALAREAQGLSAYGMHALPGTAHFARVLELQERDEMRPMYINGRWTFTVDEFVMQGPLGPVTFFNAESA